MITSQNVFSITEQGDGTPVPVGVRGERVGPSRPSASDYSTTATVVINQAAIADNATGIKPVMNQEKEVTIPPRFLIIRKSQGDFSRESPFLIQKLLFGIVGNLKNIRKINEGLLVETVSSAQSTRLLNTKRLGENTIVVEPHKSLNVVKGVVVCRDLLNSTIEEITEGLKSQGVIEVKRIKINKNGELIDTANHVLTFNKPTLPSYVNAAFYKLPVRHYIPAPMRCFRCQRYGHTAMKCDNQQICMCGKPPHESQPCEEPLKCVNCLGDHSSRSKDCPVYKQELAIQEIKVKEKLSYLEAKKKVVVQTPKTGVSYAKAISTPAKIDSASIIKELIPQLVTALKDVFVCKERKENIDETNFKTPVSQDVSRQESEDISDSESIQSYASSSIELPIEKRKREELSPDKNSPGDAIQTRSKKGKLAGKSKKK